MLKIFSSGLDAFHLKLLEKSEEIQLDENELYNFSKWITINNLVVKFLNDSTGYFAMELYLRFKKEGDSEHHFVLEPIDITENI